jgi:hypothetical protein
VPYLAAVGPWAHDGFLIPEEAYHHVNMNAWESIEQSLKTEGWTVDSTRVSEGGSFLWRLEASRGEVRRVVESDDLAAAFGMLQQQTRTASYSDALHPRFGRMDKVRAVHPREKVRMRGYVVHAEFDGQRWMYEVALPDSTETFNFWLPEEALEGGD